MENARVGSYTYFAGYNCVMNASVGRYCSIGERVMIGPGMHPSGKFVSTSPVFFSKHAQCGVTFSDDFYFSEAGITSVGNDVWIGANAVILDNIKIGDGAIIGAGAVVTKDVPEYSIVGGVPARHIRRRFSEAQIEFLLRDKWWEKDPEWVKKYFKKFHDVDKYIEFVKTGS